MPTSDPTATKPSVLFFKSPSCPHCPTVLNAFRKLEADGRLSALHVHDVMQDGELAAQYGIRSVPWFKIAALEFNGLYSAKELEYWVAHAASPEGIRRYITEQLEAGRLQPVIRLFRQESALLKTALAIIADVQSPLQARIGIGAVMEDLAGSRQLTALIPALGELARHPAHSVRIDACHYLGLSGDAAARPYLEQCLNDVDATVREVAAESLTQLTD